MKKVSVKKNKKILSNIGLNLYLLTFKLDTQMRASKHDTTIHQSQKAMSCTTLSSIESVASIVATFF